MSIERALADTRRRLLEAERVLKVSALHDTVTVEGVGAGGEAIRIRPAASDVPIVLYSHHAGCALCDPGARAISGIAEGLDCRLNAYVVSLEDSLRSLQSLEGSGRMRVVSRARGSAVAVLPIGLPSSLVVLAPGGRLLGWWQGAVEGRVANEARATLEEACQLARLGAG